MPKTLAELRAGRSADGHPARSRAVKDLCLDPSLIAEVQRLQNERRSIVATFPDTDPDQEGQDRPPRRVGMPGKVAALTDIDARIAEVHQRLTDASGEVVLEAVDSGEWRRWAAAHPVRKDNEIDGRYAYGLVDADAVADDLALWVKTFNGDPVSAEDVQWMTAVAAPGDIADMISIVVRLHEAGVAVPKSLSGSSASRQNETASPSPDSSESAPAGSTAGSQKSDTSTTTPTES